MSLPSKDWKTCLKCGQCCRDPIIDEVFETDIVREPKLEPFVKEFKNEPGQYMLTTPCPFVTIENQCSIYPTRPDICVSHEPGTNICCPLFEEQEE